MKKTKLLPSILMLIMCVAVLTVGIYAVSPAQNNVTGTITVIASNVEFDITAYLGTNKATKVSDTITARTSTPVPIYDDKLEFDGSSASSSDSVADITLVLEIKNKSASKVLGAFFLKDATLPQTITSANITNSINFDGKTADNTKTATNLVTATLPGYTQISAGATIDLVCTLSLNQLADYDMNVALNLPLVIHEFDSNLMPIPVPDATELNLSFAVTDSTNFTVSVCAPGESLSGDIVIPSKVKISGHEYIVTSLSSYPGSDENGVGHASAFAGTRITSIVIPGTIAEIPGYTFINCNSLETIIIENGVTTICDWMIGNSGTLTTLTIPASITHIGEGAFGYCSALTDVYYAGSESDWANMVIGDRNDSLIGATIHYNYVG